MRYLSQEWLDETRAMTADHPPATGPTARFQYVIAGTPEGDVKYACAMENGRLLDLVFGTVPDADVTISAPYPAWVKIARGELTMSVAFMQGTVKVAGDMGKFLDLLTMTQSDEYLALKARMRERTEYPDA